MRCVNGSRSTLPPSSCAPSTEISLIRPKGTKIVRLPQRDHQAERARRIVACERPDHHVADPADGKVVAVEQRATAQPGGENLRLLGPDDRRVPGFPSHG